MMQIIQQLKTNYKFHSKGVFRFNPKIHFQFAMGPYLVKTAENRNELIECFKLRDEVFNKEFRGLTNTEFDFDQFDSICDHIIIVHHQTQTLVGTYRLNSSLHSKSFYTEQEFEIKNLNYLKGPILELGRACIRKEHRKGTVMNLLWRGVAEYMNHSHSQTLFGCSSVKITDARDAALVYQYLKTKGHLDLRYLAKPQPAYEMDGFAIWHDYIQQDFSEALATEAEQLLPPLLKSYFKIGAKVIAEPAFDEEFNCVDFLTLLHRDRLSKTAEKKYGLEIPA